MGLRLAADAASSEDSLMDSSVSDAHGALKDDNLENSSLKHSSLKYDSLKYDSLKMISEEGPSGLISRPIMYYIKTFGCAHNQSDGEQMAGILDAAGYTYCNDPDSADLIVLNSCAVKGPGQESLGSLIAKYRQKLKPGRIVIAGCIPQSMPNSKSLEGVTIIGVQQFDKIAEVADSLFGNGIHQNSISPNHSPNYNISPNANIRLLGKSTMPKLSLPKRRNNELVEIIPINLGCLNACTYCKTKHARGHLRSYPVDDILSAARSAIDQGAQQIWLTSEDLGAYGKDIGTTLPMLLDALLGAIPKHVMIRIGMTNPPYVSEYLSELCEFLNHPQAFSFIHIPVQAASNTVLQHMKRGYLVEQFQESVDVLRSKVPNVMIATDIICGYPTETEEDFKKTMDLIAHNKFPIMNISQFYPRPDTVAAKLKQLPSQEVKRRSTELTKLFKSQMMYDSYVEKTLDVWMISTTDDCRWSIGHTKNYIQVLVPRDDSLLGKRIRVKISRAGKHFLQGDVVYD